MTASANIWTGLFLTQKQCKLRLQQMWEELRLIQGLKEQLEAELPFLKSK